MVKMGTGPLIDVGMCFAIEPMINMGSKEVYTKNDGWTICTKGWSSFCSF